MKKVSLALSAVPIAFWMTDGIAHHAGVMFDTETTITLTGVVREFQFTNPHSWLLLDVTNEDGSVTTWGFEAEGPTTLMRRGISFGDFPPGSRLTITGYPMRDGQPAGEWVMAVRESDGEEFWARPQDRE
ncbi:MAG: hypothetical protein F4053_05385 [Proteobacteria bacterium]|nr:hypothetical protein [Pseudomonadota bacterium]MYJ95033.1 hypothetical protein [Pseudomonadota bacterium]